LSDQNEFKGHESLIEKSFVVSGCLKDGAPESEETQIFQIYVKQGKAESPLWPSTSSFEGLVTKAGSDVTIDLTKVPRIPVLGKLIGELSVDIEAGKKIGSIPAQWDKDCRFSIEELLKNFKTQFLIKEKNLETSREEVRNFRRNFKSEVSIQAGSSDFFAGKEFAAQREKFSVALESVKKKNVSTKVPIYFEQDKEGPISLKKVKWEDGVKNAADFLNYFNEVFTEFCKAASAETDKKATFERDKLKNTLAELRKSTSSYLKEEETKLSRQETCRKEFEDIKSTISLIEGEGVPPLLYKVKMKKGNGEILLLNIDLREAK
jgi:hypothetical protein